MSKISLSGDAAGTGTFTIASPNSNNNRTLTLPDEAGTVATSNSPYLAFRNRIINGAMVIDQRNNGTSVTVNAPSLFFGVDRWAGYGQTTDGVFTVQRSSVAPNGFSNSLLATVTTADASVGASQIYALRQSIEGFNVADFGWGGAGAQTVTLSFWVRSSVTGTYGASVRNEAGNRSYPFTYTINSANTFEYKTITIPGDTTGTWGTGNGAGIDLWLGLGVGSTFTSAAGTWAAGNFLSANSATNFISTNGATFYITGVQLEKGSTATSFDYRPYGTELMLCQRYYYLQRNYMGQPAPFNSEATGAIAQSTATTVVYRAVRVHPVEMRAAPSVTWANLDFWDGGVQRSVTGINNNNSSLYVRSVDWNMNGNMTALGRPAYEFMQPSGFIACSAEL